MVDIQKDVVLASHTTFRIGGKARYFVAVSSAAELKEAVEFAQEKNLPFFVLGEGSNLLVSDAGFSGIVIKIKITGIEWNELPEAENFGPRVEVVMGAGEDWDDVVAQTVARNLGGFETLSGIPGTVGAAPVQNIGAYGSELKDTLSWVEVFDTQNMLTKKLTAEECEGSYRDSIFKKPEGKHFIVTRVACVLTKNATANSSYKDVQKLFAEKNITQPTLQDVRDAVLSIRRAKLPDIREYGTAGSFFKNPIISVAEYEELLKNFPEMPSFDASDGKKKIPAAWILDNLCNYKGYRKGNVGIYKNQPLVVVNFGNATAQEIIDLTDEMRTCVKKHTNIDLFPEVVHVGF